MHPRTRAARRLTLLAATAVAIACSSTRPSGPSTTEANQPRAADRYAKLLRRMLGDSNPVAVEQLVSCEAGRITEAFGVQEARRRLNVVFDTIIRTRVDSNRFSELEGTFAGQSFEVAGPFCDSVNAVAAREFPLTPTSESLGPKY